MRKFVDMRKIIGLAALSVMVLTACSEKNNELGTVEISGHIVDVNSYGQLIPDYTPAQMAAAGFDYADLINVQIGDLHLNNVPYVSSFNEVAILGPSYVDYNAHGDDYGFAMLNGDFHYYIGGKVGDKVTMTLAEKGGYRDTYELMKSVYPVERRANETAEQYANFRMVTTTGIASGVLYRSSNPLNCVNNPGRYSVVDSLARVVGINAEVDLADTPAKVSEYMKSEGYKSTYCPQLYADGRVIACGLNADTFSDQFKEGLGNAVRHIINNNPPYLIHCNEGKDRCGFVTMVLEALAGASVDEIQRDYMVTMINFYQIEDGGDSYNLRQKLSIDRMVWLMCNEEALSNFEAIDWDNIDVANIDWEGFGLYRKTLQGVTLQNAARKYLGECGLSDAEIDELYNRLTTAQ